MFEGILRWLMDRGFGCENFEETDKYYVFKQNVDQEFASFSYHVVDGGNIGVEVGSKEAGENENPGNYPEF